MTLENVEPLLLENPVGLDKAVQSIQLDLRDGLPWLQKSFGRAKEFIELDKQDKEVRIPKCLSVVEGSRGEYVNVLPCDTLASQSFIAFPGPENFVLENGEQPGMTRRQRMTRTMSVIFWFNLHRIDDTKGYDFTEELKAQVIKVLKANKYVATINACFDERIENVFDGYNPSYRYASYNINETENPYLTYPAGGFRYDITIGYEEHYDCL